MSKSRKADFDVIIPTRAGTDLENKDKTIDGHIRIETYKDIGTGIYIDLFVSKVKGADESHMTSEPFTWSDAGANQATKFLQENGFQIVVMIR
jgi:hypothetical protein